MFTALHREDFIFAGPDLDEVLDFVAGCIDPSVAEDAVIWQGGRIVAVVLATGSVMRFDVVPVPVSWRIAS